MALTPEQLQEREVSTFFKKLEIGARFIMRVNNDSYSCELIGTIRDDNDMVYRIKYRILSNSHKGEVDTDRIKYAKKIVH